MGKSAAPPLPEMFSRDQLMKPFLVMGIMWVVRQYVDTENEDHIQMIRIAFGVQLIGCFLVHSIIRSSVSFRIGSLSRSKYPPLASIDRGPGRRQ
jgi:hypothetical protein